jgi:hypothetical protein
MKFDCLSLIAGVQCEAKDYYKYVRQNIIKSMYVCIHAYLFEDPVWQRQMKMDGNEGETLF